jgi:hypothetical protein
MLALCPLGIFANGKARTAQIGQLCFVGQDAQGPVVFAVEVWHSTGDKLGWTQKKQGAWLFAEGQGWIRLSKIDQMKCLGLLDDGSAMGHVVPDKQRKLIGGNWLSESEEERTASIKVVDERNDIRLAAWGSQGQLIKRYANGQLETKNADATFIWKGRRLSGKVHLRKQIHVGTVTSGMFLEECGGARLESLQLAIGKTGFMEMQRTDEKRQTAFLGKVSLQMQLDSVGGLAEDVYIESISYKRMGLYDYPYQWQGSFSLAGKEALFKVETRELLHTDFLGFGGRRLAFAKGYLMYDGRATELTGLAEVEAAWRGKKSFIKADKHDNPGKRPAPGLDFQVIIK